MFCDVIYWLVMGTVVILSPLVQATPAEDEAFKKVLNNVVGDKCTALENTRMNAVQLANAIEKGNKYCVELRGWLRDSPNYEQGDCLHASDPKCDRIKIKTSLLRSEMKWRCTVNVPGLHYGTNRITILSCVESTVKEYNKQQAAQNAARRKSVGQYGAGQKDAGQYGAGFPFHLGPAPAKYSRGPAASQTSTTATSRRRGERSRSSSPSTKSRSSSPPSPPTKSHSVPFPPHPPRGPPPSVSVTVNPYSGKKYGTGTITEGVIERGETSGTKKSPSLKSWSWKKKGKDRNQGIKIKD